MEVAEAYQTIALSFWAKPRVDHILDSLETSCSYLHRTYKREET
jgi:methylphosphotriester-DNA--protein-cysteine methyltransferase